MTVSAPGALPPPRAVTHRIPKLQRSVEKRLYAPWFWGKDFSTNWAMGHIPTWRRVLAPWRNVPIRILEIGSWEGRSAVFFLNFLKRSHITCVDTFGGGHDTVDNELTPEVPKIEARFDRNLAPFRGRFEKIRQPSGDALPLLATAGRKFDLAYIDGSHTYADVLLDSQLTWPMVVTGGVVIWDDYDWALQPDRPGPAIDEFLAGKEGQYRLLSKSGQMIVEKRA